MVLTKGIEIHSIKVSEKEKNSTHMVFFFLTLFIYLFLAVLGLRRCAGFSLVAERGCYSVAMLHRLPIAVASLVEHGL